MIPEGGLAGDGCKIGQSPRDLVCCTRDIPDSAGEWPRWRKGVISDVKSRCNLININYKYIILWC